MLKLKAKCVRCGGKGAVPHDPYPDPCNECEGEGEVLTEDGQAVAELVSQMLDSRQERQELRARLLAKQSPKRGA